jgi:hypothetical protein
MPMLMVRSVTVLGVLGSLQEFGVPHRLLLALQHQALSLCLAQAPALPFTALPVVLCGTTSPAGTLTAMGLLRMVVRSTQPQTP